MRRMCSDQGMAGAQSNGGAVGATPSFTTIYCRRRGYGDTAAWPPSHTRGRDRYGILV